MRVKAAYFLFLLSVSPVRLSALKKATMCFTKNTSDRFVAISDERIARALLQNEKRFSG
jgi:hypothetical protein